MATTPITTIKEIGVTEGKKYKHIRLGDEEGTGECIGIGKTYGYYGCSNCWKKVEEIAKMCGSCSAPTTTKTNEFSAELYFEIDHEILTLQGFSYESLSKCVSSYVRG